MSIEERIDLAANLIVNSKHTTAFTGAGISVESGIPSFRGADGIWDTYDPMMLQMDFFLKYPEESWKTIVKIFYSFMGEAKPNSAHSTLAKLQKNGLLHAIITQNIDNLHQLAGSTNVYEFHGTMNTMVCLKCNKKFDKNDISLKKLPPKCPDCKGIIKPNFIFFGEGIPEKAYNSSFDEIDLAEVFIVIGTTGEVMPACSIPIIAKRKGAKIIEINTETSSFTNSITDIFLQGKAGEMMVLLGNKVDQIRSSK